MADVLAKLLEAKWRKIPFPVTSMRMSLAHDLVEHKYWGVDGARVEATGVAPLRFSFRVPLHDGIFPGKNETWKANELYTVTFRKLLTAFAKKQNGELQHPEFGTIICKPEKFDVEWDGGKRGGCEVECSFIETISDQELLLAIPRPNPRTEMSVAAQDLDASETDLLALVPGLPQYPETFDDFARAVQGVFDQATILSMQAAGKIDSIVYRANAIGDSIDRARSALTWPATENVERIKAAAHGLREKLLQLGRDIVIYRTPAESTVAGIARVLSDTSLGDLVKLNPHLMIKPTVPQGTVIRYYASKLPI